ncbi:MAG: hypothetical protein V3U35_03130 [Candidatus Neomarinimicrobiota bacterium]
MTVGHVLIIEKERRVVEALELLLQALDRPYDVASTFSNAVRVFTTERIDIIFINPELASLDAKPLLDEFEVAAEDKRQARPPVIVLYTDEALVKRYGLNQLADTELVKKPFSLDEIYAILDKRGLTKVKMVRGNQREKDKAAQFEQFIQRSEAWLDKLKNHLIKE